MKFKTVLKLITTASLMLSLSLTALGMDSDMNTGGGTSSQANNFVWYKNGAYGARVSLVTETGSTKSTFDMVNSEFGIPTEVYHFSQQNKLTTMKKSSLVPKQGYKKKDTKNRMPLLISGQNEQTNQQSIIEYFTDDTTLQFIASNTGTTIDEIKQGKYSVLVEPILYLKHKQSGAIYAFTATEAGIFDKQSNGVLYKDASLVTHGGLPKGLYLKNPFCGIQPASSGLLSKGKI